ncbi:MAG: hypothetical protein Unbinned5784contig1000_10 [Prokaryotic dsDNA virus sp.]|nr:MAG: hypothetical protein Unbinned5784contig1000_10 [Prokaryotic dsDNA virus sp.]
MRFIVPVSPIPAPRPRVTKQGWSYYPKRYKDWRKTVGEMLPDILTDTGLEAPLEGPLLVAAKFIVKRPKTTKLSHPRGDLDNFEKSLWDALTTAQVWLDDVQIVCSHSSKEWAKPGEEGKIEVMIKCKS